jgi:hypothetical protein
MKPIQHVLVLIIFALFNNIAAAEEFEFDVSSYQKKNYHFGGFLEYSFNHQIINQDAAATKLLFIDDAPPDTLSQHAGILELNGEYKQEKWQGRFTYHGESADDELTSIRESKLYEALVSWQPDTGATFDVGKKAIKWGKAYAWNPVAFVERPKNPDDPNLSREGYIIATADLIKSFNGSVKTLAFTPVYLPVTEDINNDYGPADNHNLAAKLYLLYEDTDIDFVFLGEGSHSKRYGFDFAKNISTNFEVHGEWAHIDKVTRQTLLDDGTINIDTDSETRWLLGLRYLTENEITIIAEYYVNNGGYSADEMEVFYKAVNTADAANNITQLNNLLRVGEKNYLIRNPGKEYLYLRLSIKEPFDWVYFIPAVSSIYNIEDHSYSVSPELLYSGYGDFEFRFKATLLYGDTYSEFSEKRNEQKYELRVRYYY